jgi:hypothetical protein
LCLSRRPLSCSRILFGVKTVVVIVVGPGVDADALIADGNEDVVVVAADRNRVSPVAVGTLVVQALVRALMTPIPGTGSPFSLWFEDPV